MSKDPSPWSQPDPRWQPQSYQDQARRDPRQPFGSEPSPARGGGGPTSLQDFQDPGRGRRPWWAIIGGGIALLVVVLLVWQFAGTEPEDEPTAGPTATSAPNPSISVPNSSATGGSSIPFEGNGNGVFEILQERWDDDGVVVRFRVTVESGQEGFAIYMFNNASMEVSDPVDPHIFTATRDKPFEGEVRFVAERGPGTLVLANALGRALTALPIRG